jgi:GTP cyclohydrolase I
MLAWTGADIDSLHISEDENLITVIDRRAMCMYMKGMNDDRSAMTAESRTFREHCQEPGI